MTKKASSIEKIFSFMWREASSTRMTGEEIEAKAKAKAQILQFINSIVDEVIGEDDFETNDRETARNRLRKEQRQRLNKLLEKS